jgi:hypothetical protein
MNIVALAKKSVRVVRREGFTGIASRVTRRAAERWGGNISPVHIRPEDIVDSARLGQVPLGPAKVVGEKLSIGWILTVPGPGSGGHTTIFRLVEGLEAAGHRCVLYLYDGQGGDARQYDAIIRTGWPGVKAEIRSERDGIAGMDAYVATAWVTAHVLAKHSDVSGARFYLIQDYEPWFYPRGWAYELAEDSYRFGFASITIGHMLADELKQRFGYDSTVAEFGCDTEVYNVQNRGKRNGVVFYAKPGVARRGYEMGVLALEQFHALRPDVEIHTFGVKAPGLPFPATAHGNMSPAALNTLYNSCGAGLALSFTNISLIPYELLAAGAVPVMNDFVGLRSNLDNPHVIWSRATPGALAEALTRALDHRGRHEGDELSASVDGLSWRSAQAAVVAAIESGTRG